MNDLMNPPKRPVCILSGGMDSATLLWWLAAKKCEPIALSVDYCQRHDKELEAAAKLCYELGVFHHTVELPKLASVMKGSSQTDPDVAVPEGHYEEPSMRQTVVPNRNMILLSVGAAFAISTQRECIAYGAHAGDHAIYPDCRASFVKAMQKPLSLCHYYPLHVYAPFLQMDKGEVAVIGEGLGVPFDLTWTCYKGEDVACGKCGACQERLEAFKETSMGDPLEYAS